MPTTSNLIEGHNTRPRDIERALAGDLERDRERRNLQLEAAAHVRVQAQIDALAAEGHHAPRSGARIADFMRYFAERYALAPLGKSGRIISMAAAHHRCNYIHPFPDGNGRVSRLMSHAMAHVAGIGAHGLWSISRGVCAITSS